MVICTKCGREAADDETFCGRCGAFLEWTGVRASPTEPQPPAAVAPPAIVPARVPPRHGDGQPGQAGPPIIATPSARRVRAEPGGQVAISIEVHNRGRTVDQVSLDVVGPTAAWSSVEPRQLNLMPGTSAVAAIAFRPPRSAAVPAGENPVDISIRSSQHPEASVVERVSVEVVPFVAFETTLTPSILRGVAATAALLRVTNGGNAPLELSFASDDPEMALSSSIDPPTVHLDRGTTTDAVVVVKPLTPLQSGPDRSRPFRIVVTAGEGYRRVVDATFVQVAKPPPPPPPEPAFTGPFLVVELSAPGARVEPGSSAGVTVEVHNRGRTADRASLEIAGPAAAWASAQPSRLQLAPDATAVAAIEFRPPRRYDTRPGRYAVDVVVRSAEHASASVVERVAVDVLPFVALEISLAPSVLRGSHEATAKLRVASRGNAPVELSLAGEDPEMALQFRFSPPKIRLNPGAAGQATVSVRARKGTGARGELSRPFVVIAAAGDGLRVATDGTFITTARRHGCLARLFAILLLPVLTAVIAGAALLTRQAIWSETGYGDPGVATVVALVISGVGAILAVRWIVGLWRGPR